MKTNLHTRNPWFPMIGNLRRVVFQSLELCAAAAFLAAFGARAATLPVTVPLGSYTNGLVAPARLATDASGRLYVSEPSAGRVVVVDAFGLISSVKTGLANPLGIAVDADGNILVGEADNHCVSVFDSNWNFVTKLGSGDGEFSLPGHIAIDPLNGNVFVSDGLANLVKVFTNGSPAFSFGGTGYTNGVFDFCAGVAFTSNEVYVVDQNNNRAQVFDHAGNYLRQFQISAGMAGANGRCQGAWADGSGRLYFTDVYQGYIRVYATNGVKIGNIASFGEGGGQLRSPVDVSFDFLNRMFVAAPNNGRVELYGIDGFIHVSASPANDVIAAGTNLVLSAIISGAGSFAYQWQRNGTNLTDGGNISGATNSSLTVAGITGTDGGSYSVVITGTNGTVTLGASQVSVLAAPAITVQPQPLTVAQGAAASFSVTATGDALSYQWTRDLADIPGATNATLDLAGVTPVDAGQYGVVVQNLVGTATSDQVTLTVIAPPVITLHPTDLVVLRGETATFDALAEGTGLSYQWYQDAAPLIGEDGNLVAIPNANPINEGQYRLVVSNIAGSVQSDAAVLSVLIPPSTNEINTLVFQPDGIEISLNADPGFDYALDFSTNLDEWVRIALMTNAPSSFLYLDTEHTNDMLRFYRLRWSH